MILAVCEANGIPAEEADLTREEVTAADEIFLMGTMSGLVGATSLDGMPVGNGALGSITRQLAELYRAALNDPANGYDMKLPRS